MMQKKTEHRADSQVMVILDHLKTGAEINPREAWDKYGIYRLGACIEILRKEGYHISTKLKYFKKPNGNTGHYAIYKLEE